MIKMDKVTIRKAMPSDAAEISNVHINSWREAYRGLLPEAFLNDRPLYFKSRYELWKMILENADQMIFVAECSQNGVVGFISGDHGREPEYKDYAEVQCLYLLEKYHHQKIGFKLLKSFFDKAKARGFQKAYLWVLKDNPTINFYKKTGGFFNGHSQEENIAGQNATEFCYLWHSLNLEK